MLLLVVLLIASLLVNIHFWRTRIQLVKYSSRYKVVFPDGTVFMIPYSTRACTRNLNTKVYLRTLKETICITQPPGTMYPFSATELNGESFFIVNGAKSLSGSAKPKYLTDTDLCTYT